MGTRHTIGIALMLFAVSSMAEPPQRHSAAPRAGAPVKPGAASPAPLKLQIGDVRKYMMPTEYRAAIGAPDPDKSTIVVEGSAPAGMNGSLRAFIISVGTAIRASQGLLLARVQ